MSTLNQDIDNATKFHPDASHNAPVIDQSGHARFAIEMSARHAAAALSATPPPPIASLGSMPIPN